MSLVRVSFARILLTITFLSPAAAFAVAGNEGPHGGDYVASEFIIRGQAVLEAIQNNTANAVLLDANKRIALSTAVNKTPVESVDHDLYDSFHRTVDAITMNDPTSPTGKLIQLNRAR